MSLHLYEGFLIHHFNEDGHELLMIFLLCLGGKLSQEECEARETRISDSNILINNTLACEFNSIGHVLGHALLASLSYKSHEHVASLALLPLGALDTGLYNSEKWSHHDFLSQIV
jgi:hypothetical protein